MGGKRKVLIAVDGSKHSDHTFKWYIERIHHEGDHVYLAWNVDSKPATFGTVNLMTGDPDVISKIIHEQRNHVDATVSHLKHQLHEHKLRGQVLLLHGTKPGETIIEAANAEGVDLIIVGSRGHSVLRRTVLGSVSDYVIHHSHKPVMVCKLRN